MRARLLSLVVAGLGLFGVTQGAIAAPAMMAPLAATAPAPAAVPVQYYGYGWPPPDWRRHEEWRREREWRRYEAWRWRHEHRWFERGY